MIDGIMYGISVFVGIIAGIGVTIGVDYFKSYDCRIAFCG